MRLVAEGESLLFPASVRRLAAQYGAEGGNRTARALLERARLTEREAEVLRHVSAVLAKLGARDRTSRGSSRRAEPGAWPAGGRTTGG